MIYHDPLKKIQMPDKSKPLMHDNKIRIQMILLLRPILTIESVLLIALIHLLTLLRLRRLIIFLIGLKILLGVLLIIKLTILQNQIIQKKKTHQIKQIPELVKAHEIVKTSVNLMTNQVQITLNLTINTAEHSQLEHLNEYHMPWLVRINHDVIQLKHD